MREALEWKLEMEKRSTDLAEGLSREEMKELLSQVRQGRTKASEVEGRLGYYYVLETRIPCDDSDKDSIIPLARLYILYTS